MEVDGGEAKGARLGDSAGEIVKTVARAAQISAVAADKNTLSTGTR